MVNKTSANARSSAGDVWQQAIAAHQSGQFDRARQLYEAVLRAAPGNADALHLLGIVAAQTGRPHEALELIERAIAIIPHNADFHSNRGNVMQALGRFDDALASHDKAIAIKPGSADAHSNRGNALKELKRLTEAIACYDRAIALKPNSVEAHSNLGSVLHDLKRFDEAIASYDKAIAIKPDHVKAHFNRGNVLRDLKRFDEAVASYDRAIGIKPDYAVAYCNRGNALKELRRLDDAIASYDKAIAIKPDYAEAHSNRGYILAELKHLDEALASYDKAIAVGPDYATAYWNKSLACLLMGDLSLGWALYEWRWKERNGPRQRTFSQPVWLGDDPLQGKTILLHGEQGLGDAIQFCRYAPMVANLGAKVILEVFAPLVGLMNGLPGIDQVVAAGEPLPEFDCHCPLMSLPLAFKTRLIDIPRSSAYLFADSAKQDEWNSRLGQKDKPRIGLVWSGSTTHEKDHDRSLTLATLLPYVPAGYQYICLQKELREVDRAVVEATPDLQFFGEELKDFMDTAALCTQLDLVISVDTSVAHLAGALGQETWVLLPYVPDWRWLLDRDDSPWYPSVKLYRQPNLGDWDGALKKMAANLEARLSARLVNLAARRTA